MFKLKRISAGVYSVLGTSITIQKYDNFWYAFDVITGQSVVDRQKTKREIISSLASVYRNYIIIRNYVIV